MPADAPPPDLNSAATNAPRTPEDGPSEAELLGRPAGGWRERLFSIVFESDTRAGRRFDVVLIVVILASVGVVMLDSVQSITDRWGAELTHLEWAFTAVFALEYLARLVSVQRPLRYALSFYGVIDLLALLPTLAAALYPSLALLIDIRILRLLRIFRIFKLSHYAVEYRSLGNALGASRRKITIFLGFVMMVVLVTGTLMYVIEGAENGYTSIPVSIYWAISTMTTVGFGDIAPKTDLGRLIASVMMLVGWGILAVPTGIVTAEFARQYDSMGGEVPKARDVIGGALGAPAGEGDAGAASLRGAGRAGGGAGSDATTNAASDAPEPACPSCGVGGHASDAVFCRLCSTGLH